MTITNTYHSCGILNGMEYIQNKGFIISIWFPFLQVVSYIFCWNWVSAKQWINRWLPCSKMSDHACAEGISSKANGMRFVHGLFCSVLSLNKYDDIRWLCVLIWYISCSASKSLEVEFTNSFASSFYSMAMQIRMYTYIYIYIYHHICIRNTSLHLLYLFIFFINQDYKKIW